MAPSAPTTARVHSIDILRGVSVLGILVVNCAYFAMPLGEAGDLPPAESRTWAQLLAWGSVRALFELKFVTLFSFLFGIGFAMQSERSHGELGFGERQLRRLGLLALFGLLHGVLLFMGDILLCYAVCGVALLLCRPLSARVMLALGVLLVLVMVPWIALLTALDSLEGADAVAEVALAEGPVGALEAFVAPFGGDPAAMAPLERRVFAEGPLASSIALRAGEFLLFLFVCAFYFGWRVLGVFLLGAAAFRLGLLEERGRRWRRRMRAVGLSVGLPLTLAASAIAVRGGDAPSALSGALAGGLGELAARFLAAGDAGRLLLWGEAASGALARALAAVGRTALTNYIGQSIVMCLVVCHWGLGLYGQLTLPQLLLLSASIFTLQLIVSPLWLARYHMGPLEWVWRWGTYGSRPAFRR